MSYSAEPHKIFEGRTHLTKDQLQLLFASTQRPLIFELPMQQRGDKLGRVVIFSGGDSLDIAWLILFYERQGEKLAFLIGDFMFDELGVSSGWRCGDVILLPVWLGLACSHF